MKHDVAVVGLADVVFQRVDDAELALERAPALAAGCALNRKFVVHTEAHAVDLVPKVVHTLADAVQVRHEIVCMNVVALEGAAWAEVQVAHDLVHTHLAGDVAALVVLLAHMF